MVLEWWWLKVADRDGSGGAGAAYGVEEGEAPRSRAVSQARQTVDGGEDGCRLVGRVPGGPMSQIMRRGVGVCRGQWLPVVVRHLALGRLMGGARAGGGGVGRGNSSRAFAGRGGRRGMGGGGVMR
jgi:hypothetical protein